MRSYFRSGKKTIHIFYRRKNADGEWSGGAMYYLQDGLGSYKGCKVVGRILAVLFSIFAALASFGIGNMSQVNSITGSVIGAVSQEDIIGKVFLRVWPISEIGLVY